MARTRTAQLNALHRQLAVAPTVDLSTMRRYRLRHGIAHALQAGDVGRAESLALDPGQLLDRLQVDGGEAALDAALQIRAVARRGSRPLESWSAFLDGALHLLTRSAEKADAPRVLQQIMAEAHPNEPWLALDVARLVHRCLSPDLVGGCRRPRALNGEELEYIRGLLAELPDSTLREVQGAFADEYERVVPIATLHEAIRKRLGITRKRGPAGRPSVPAAPPPRVIVR